MALTLLTTPEKTVNGILSNVNAGRTQLPYTFQEDDLSGKTNYKVEIQLYEVDGTTPLIPQSFRYSPRPDGSLFIDMSQLLTDEHEQTERVSIEYILSYRAIWNEQTSTPTYIATPTIQSIYAEKQLLDVGGSNMWEYLLNLSPLAQPLTVVENNKLWKGFTRLYNYIIDSGFAARVGNTTDISSEDASVDKNKGFVALISEQLINVSVAGSFFLQVPESTSFYTRTRIFNKDTRESLVESSFYENIDTEGCENLVYIGWVNSKGGFEQWMFEYDQTVQRTVEEGLLSENPINADVENVGRTKRRFPNVWTQQMILTAEQLTKDQLRALAEIKQSDYVVVYLEPDLSKEVSVIVSNGYQTTWNTREELYSYSLQIEFPNNFDFLLAKNY